MDILIKSFTRPYYLDKCIQSIKHYITGEYTIIILDDGTPKKFLDEIHNRYPDVIIRKSPFYENKIQTINRHLNNEYQDKLNLQIPSKFWQQNAANASDYFLLLEDDMWITEKIDISDIEMMMRTHNIALVKTALFGLKFYKQFDSDQLGYQLTEIAPKLSKFSPFLYRKIFVENAFKLHSVLARLKLTNINTFLPIYAVYMVAGAFYEKKYYDYIWNGYEGMVNENYQLYRVLKYNKEFSAKKYARFNRDSLATSFSSSATNRFDGITLDPFVYNHILSEAWLDRKLPDQPNHGDDFNEHIIAEILEEVKHPSAAASEWKKWTERFKKQYRDIGYNI